jgi:hypothetical protein
MQQQQQQQQLLLYPFRCWETPGSEVRSAGGAPFIFFFFRYFLEILF